MAKGNFYQKLRIFDSKLISAVSILLFIVVTVTIFVSNRYMNICLQKEAAAQQNRIELHNLGEELADASDHLTDEARKFAVTGEIVHFYNYWHEVYETKTRDNVISELSSYDPPENEQALLTEAKAYSDALIETETISMKLTLLARNHELVDFETDPKLYAYLQYVYDYELPEKYSSLSDEQMEKKAVEILYDSFYYESKNLIMSPIEEFQSVMDERLNHSVENSIQGQDTASVVQICCSIVVLALIGLLILGLNVLYVRPLNKYAAALSADSIQNQLEQQDFSKVRVTPQGARELYCFGEIFNHLSLILYKELKKRVAAEKEMRSARDEADRANRAKSDFFAQMSHELRTPLNAIIGYMYLLNETPLNEEQREYCRIIDFSSENLLGLINNILDFSKMESGNMVFETTDFDLPQLIRDVYNMMKSNAMQKNLTLQLHLSEQLPQFVKGDPLKLRQVLVNLLSNALKFTPGGTISMMADVQCEENGKWVIAFGVRDSGIGIAEEDIDKIFQPFVQSDAGVTRRYGGTGLGLPISQSIVSNASNGKYEIKVDSVLDQGSYFHFQMEFLPGKQADISSDKSEKFAGFEKNITVLLVEDNDINLEMERLILEEYGLTVFTAKSGMEALSFAEENSFDMIFLDLHMPEMDGYETARRLRLLKNCRYTPVIALTADVVSGVKEKVEQSDMNAYLSKPFQPEQLRRLIAEYLHISKNEPERILTKSSTAFDCDACLRKLNGNENALQKLVQRFLDTHGHDCEYIENHIYNGYWTNAGKILHDIMGISGNLCCQKLYRISCVLNQEIKEERADTLTEFQQIWKETIEALKTYSEMHIQDDHSVTGEISFPEVWRKFISLCSAYDISAADYFDENRSTFKTEFGKVDFIQLEQAVRRYDFPWITENITYQEEE
ncbi:response regulator [Porcipelethomonas sp.]|uniref:response regulator n=1 Tax=Porcipelethomonas sp. TaxID=2981675 RepID=UPI003EF78EA4